MAPKRLKSRLWQLGLFKKVNPSQAICLVCPGKKLSTNNGSTTALRKHLMAKHTDYIEKLVSGEGINAEEIAERPGASVIIKTEEPLRYFDELIISAKASAPMAVVQERREYKDKDHLLEGLLAYPKNANGKLPTVVIFHAFLGLSEHEENAAVKLAELGFVAFAANVYGKGIKYTSKEEGFAALGEYRKARSTLLRGRLLSALNFVKTLPNVDHDKLNVIGFCFGGMAALDLARINSGIKAAVSFHGSYGPIDDEKEFDKMPPIDAKVLVLHGDEDSHTNESVPAFFDELRARKTDFQFIRYALAKHGFSMEMHKNFSFPGVGYHEPTKKRSWVHMLQLFNELYDLPKAADISQSNTI